MLALVEIPARRDETYMVACRPTEVNALPYFFKNYSKGNSIASTRKQVYLTVILNHFFNGVDVASAITRPWVPTAL
jgi:hypothetical protein